MWYTRSIQNRDANIFLLAKDPIEKFELRLVPYSSKENVEIALNGAPRTFLKKKYSKRKSIIGTVME